jgi:hypothetical protein
MAVTFTYKGRIYASIPVLPIRRGSLVFVVSASVGFLSEGLRLVKQVGRVETIDFPGTPQHHWWSYKHTAEYVLPAPTATIVRIVADNGDYGIFLYSDLLHVMWLSLDVHPKSFPTQLVLKM